MIQVKGIDDEEQRLDFYAHDYANFWVTSNYAQPKKIRVCEANETGPDRDGFSSKKGKFTDFSSMEPQDADYSYIPKFVYDVEDLILAKLPRSEYYKLPLVNKRFLSLVSSGELYKIRKSFGFKEPSVFMLATGEYIWWSFDRKFKTQRKLPDLPADICFKHADKETLCAGTHLLVSGKEYGGNAIWIYKLETNKWCKGPCMVNPRCMFASATCGSFAYVAGGIGTEITGIEVLNSAERYNPDTESWEPIRNMQRKRKSCSGFYMDDKFYVIGGINEEGEALICGEYFDEERKKWELIPDMLDVPCLTSFSPPLVAVVNNELYSLEASTNELKVFMKKSNTWKKLGGVPVKADSRRGWGVAFKSLGDELLVIGASSDSYAGNGMIIYTCHPEPETGSLHWMPLETDKSRLGDFVFNCCVMVA